MRLRILHTLFALSCCLVAACSSDGTGDSDAADTSDREDVTVRPGRDVGGPAPDVDADAPDATSDAAPDAADAADTGDEPDAADVGSDADVLEDVAPDVPCVPGCVLQGAAACDAATGGVIRCTDVDGCLQFSAPVACSPGTECLGGSCVPSICEDACTAGTTRCAPAGAGIQGCLDADGDGCVEWDVPTACPDDVTCASGTCPGACASTCVDGTFSCDDGGVRQCYDTNGDGCVELGAAIACPDGSTCDAGECIPIEGDCLVLSEVIEGSSNNKAIEIYQCGGAPLNVSNVFVCTSANTSSTCNFQSGLSGTMPPGDILTLCNTSISRTYSGRCDDTSAAAIFNGDDRIVLYRDVNGNEELDRGVDEIFDAFGETTRRPTSEIWGNITFRRCSREYYDGSGAFDVARYYREFPEDDFSNLGTAPDLGGCP